MGGPTARFTARTRTILVEVMKIRGSLASSGSIDYCEEVRVLVRNEPLHALGCSINAIRVSSSFVA